MAYVNPDFKTKKALKEAVKRGDHVTIYQPGGFFPLYMTRGRVAVEGPHAPKMHTWYAVCLIDDRHRVTKVIS